MEFKEENFMRPKQLWKFEVGDMVRLVGSGYIWNFWEDNIEDFRELGINKSKYINVGRNEGSDIYLKYPLNKTVYMIIGRINFSSCNIYGCRAGDGREFPLQEEGLELDLPF